MLADNLYFPVIFPCALSAGERGRKLQKCLGIGPNQSHVTLAPALAALEYIAESRCGSKSRLSRLKIRTTRAARAAAALDRDRCHRFLKSWTPLRAAAALAVLAVPIFSRESRDLEPRGSELYCSEPRYIILASLTGGGQA